MKTTKKYRIDVRVTEKQKDEISKMANTCNMNVSSFILEKVYSRPTEQAKCRSRRDKKPDVLTACTYHSQNIANLLKKHGIDIPEIDKEVEELWNLLH